MTDSGHPDTAGPGTPDTDAMPTLAPTVPLTQAARRLGVSERQARRLAPRLGGRRIAGRWFIDETALTEHLDGAHP